MRYIKLFFTTLILIFILASCGQSTDVDEPGVCESYGVQERNIVLGEVDNIFELPDSEIKSVCGPSGWVNSDNAGCYKVKKDGLVDVYFRNGDQCTKNHELCHVRHGPYHNARYRSDMAKGHPRPTCPP